jgi:hypothetical protein
LDASTRFDVYRFRLLLLAMVVLYAAHPIIGSSELRGAVLGPAGLLAVAATLFALRGRGWIFWTALVLALPAVMGPALPGSGVTDLAGSGFHAPLFCFAAGALTQRVLGAERAHADTIAGSVCAYLLLALAFASLYAALETLHPGALAFARPPAEDQLFHDLLYFSLVAITTLGYGDITPVAPAAVALATVEPVVGILFLSIVVARLVSLVASGGGRLFAPHDVGVLRRPGRFELLVGVALAGMLAAPFSEGPVMTLVLRAAGTALLLAALYASVEGRISRGVGLTLAALVTLLRWQPGSADWVEPTAQIFELAFLLLVTLTLMAWLARERQVTRDMLLASIGLYLILGFAFARALGLAESLAPGSIAGPAGGPPPSAQLVYYSFMTLTTTGFGDFSPSSALVERLATLEALIGVFYPPVLVGRLVSLYQSEP